MALDRGSRLGPYEIVALLGAGGMGEVYRARDTKLNRDVAVKILADAFANDPDRLARFSREAQMLAALNHPHIAHIHGLEDSGGVRALIMEFVDGDDLTLRITRGPIPIDEALPIARQVADALEFAHEQGIVHRDLKPANIKVRPDGTVKVLDFGLAKVLETTGAVASDATASPTITSPALTQMGVILGTAAYMSPEQAKGRTVDRRSDIWAFGCVVYEMLTGRRAYHGEDVSETLAAVLRSEPDWTALPSSTPEPVRRLLRRCLTKDRKARIGDASIARIEIDDALNSPAADREPTGTTSHRRIHMAWASIATGLVVAAASALLWALRSTPAPLETRLEITTPPTTDVISLAISPDGRKIVFAAKSAGRSQLWVRSLDSGSARPLAGTAQATQPFWSPDSRSIAFFADSKLKRLDIDGGSPQVLASAGLGLGGAWQRDGSILFVPAIGSPIVRLPAGGGQPVPVTRLAPEQISHRLPQMLPDDRHFAYYATGRADVAGLYVGQVDGGEARRLFDADSSALYASGHLFFVRQSTLFAQPFNLGRLERTGNPIFVAEQIATNNNLRAVAVSTSAAGSIIYRTSLTAGQRQFVWVDRSGKEVERVGGPDPAEPRAPSLSPDGSRVALTRIGNASSDIWLLDMVRGMPTRFTVDERGSYPIWSADGQQIAYTSTRGSESHILLKPVTRGGDTQDLYVSPGFSNATDWSRDGRFLLFRHADPGKSNDIWTMPMLGERKAFPVVQTQFDERDAQFSPDGKWIAYQSDESGQYEIYVQQFPVTGGKERISANGGAQVRWRSDGKELFYIALDDRLMAVSIALPASGGRVEAGLPRELFATRIGGAVQGVARQQYVVSPDGQRFLMNTVPEESSPPITVVLNWNPKR